MKTVRCGSKVRRAHDSLAALLVKEHNYSYCPKQVYKKARVIKSAIHREVVEHEAG